jgi:hypothetical protein
MKSNILTRSGHYFDFVDLESNVVTLEDIAHGLSHVCRYAGQCPNFYSVAQHSVLVAQLLERCYGITDRSVLRQGLLHDATEAFIGDVTSPLKRLLPDYQALEARLHADLMRRFGLPAELDPAVKLADLLALGIEKRELWGNEDEWAVLGGLKIPKWDLVELPAQTTKLRFLHLYNSLESF